jgi:hypothetical protein
MALIEKDLRGWWDRHKLSIPKEATAEFTLSLAQRDSRREYSSTELLDLWECWQRAFDAGADRVLGCARVIVVDPAYRRDICQGAQKVIDEYKLRGKPNSKE